MGGYEQFSCVIMTRRFPLKINVCIYCSQEVPYFEIKCQEEKDLFILGAEEIGY